MEGGGGGNYDLGLTKASFLIQLVKRYIHALNMGVVGWQEFYILHNIVKWHLIHLRYTLVDYIIHRGYHTWLIAIFAEP